MISDFPSREFGFGFYWGDLSYADLRRINDFRADKSYMDEDDAKLLQNGSALKKYLSREDNHFVVLFEYGNSYNKQWYWSYEHLVLKIEECLELLKFLYLSFGLVFLFDHPCGHYWSLEGGLKSSIVRKYFGGKQPNMKDTVMLREYGFLGPYGRILETGDTQNMWWYPALTDIQLTGHFWISEL